VPVRERGWARAEDRLRPPGSGAFVVTRYGLMDAFASRAFLAFYVLCLLPSLVAIVAVYLSHSAALVEQVPDLADLLDAVPEWVFLHLFGWQAMPAFLVAVVAAPPLIAADLGHNALTLILSRPLSRAEYVLGKIGILVALLSPVTWVPALALCALQSMLAGGGWIVANARVPFAYVVGHWAWMLIVALFGLAVSSLVRHAVVARGVMLAVVVVGAGTGAILNQLTRTALGDLLRLPTAIESVVASLLGQPTPGGLPVALNWLTLTALAALSLAVLARRLRACEEVS
jgi:ABC-type transport system involved in multi-copper enzyme maturation permease subunit